MKRAAPYTSNVKSHSSRIRRKNTFFSTHFSHHSDGPFFPPKRFLAHPLQQRGRPDIQRQDKPNPVRNRKSGEIRYEFMGRWYEQQHFDFFRHAAYDTLAACLQENFSMMGSLFVVALATTESGWGRYNGGEAYHNLFSIMGGKEGNISTSHGRLRNFPSYEAGFNEGFLQKIVDGVDAAKKPKFPHIRPVLSKANFTIDELNEAFGQAAYHNPGKRYSYEDSNRPEWGKRYFDNMKETTIPFMRYTLTDKMEYFAQLYRMVPDEDRLMIHPEIRKLRTWLTLLDQAQANIESQLEAVQSGKRQ